MKSTPVFLGIDCGATTSKIGAVDATGESVSRTLRQSDTTADGGADAMLTGWIAGCEGFLAGQGLAWSDVGGVGLAIPGPYLGHGILGVMPNMPSFLTGWNFLEDLRGAVERAAGRSIPVATANDGQLAGLPEARLLQSQAPGGVLLLAPGSGLGCSYVNPDGTILSGDHGAAAILSHMPAPYERLGLPAFRCGCGRDWGCFEAYTTISGLPQYLKFLLPKFPGHTLTKAGPPDKKMALSLRTRAREGDPLAVEIFDRQARVLGYTAAVGCMAYDPTHIVIGGGLMDPESTTPEFRSRYLAQVRKGTAEVHWGDMAELQFHEASFGELSQAIGAALLALENYTESSAKS